MPTAFLTRRQLLQGAAAAAALPWQAASAAIGGGKPISLVVSYPAGGALQQLPAIQWSGWHGGSFR